MLDMTIKELSSRQVRLDESLRLGVLSGWYTTKMNGTFVTGPHATEQEAALKIAEMRPPGPPAPMRKS